MRQPSIIPKRAAIIAAVSLVLLILLSATANVPWALSRMPSRTSVVQVPTDEVDEVNMRRDWPSETPHRTAWPAPNNWHEGGFLGCRVYYVDRLDTGSGQALFQMEVQHLGWPLPVIEIKQMWWDWDNPALAGPESDPPPALMLNGLILNPLIIGGGAWMILVLPWLLGIMVIRWSRRRCRHCMQCAYPIGDSPVCTECGAIVGSSSRSEPA